MVTWWGLRCVYSARETLQPSVALVEGARGLLTDCPALQLMDWRAGQSNVAAYVMILMKEIQHHVVETFQ